MPHLSDRIRRTSPARLAGIARLISLRPTLWTLCVAGLVFQSWHIVEHSPQPGQPLREAELLYLAASAIFLAGLACLHACLRSRWTRLALYVQGFHLFEHVLLAASAMSLAEPTGLSTLFGYAGRIAGDEFATVHRTAWHIVMNALPLLFALIGLAQHWRSNPASTTASRPSPESRQIFGGAACPPPTRPT